MGDKEQSGMLRIVVIVGIIALLVFGVIKAIQASIVEETFTTNVTAVHTVPTNGVRDTSYRNVADKLASLNWKADSAHLGIYPKASWSYFGDDWASASKFLEGPTSFYGYITRAKSYDGDESVYSKTKYINSGSSWYASTPGNKSLEATTPQWNIASVTLKDGRKFDFSNDFDENHFVIFQNQKNLDTMKEIMGLSNINMMTMASVSLESITYENGLTIHEGDSIFRSYAGIRSSTNYLAAYNQDGSFNTDIITSGLQKSFQGTGLRVIFGTDIKLSLSIASGWPGVNINIDKHYDFDDKQSFNNLQKEHPKEWDKLIKMG